MWCPQCQADVATEVAADGQALLCTACGGEIRKVFAPSLHPETRSARELLERWASDDLLDAPLAEPPAAAGSDRPGPKSSRPGRREAMPPESADPRPARESSRPKFRIDAAHPREEVVRHHNAPDPAQAPRPQSAARVPESLPPGYRQDAGHSSLPAPHFDIQAAITPPPRSGRSESLWGQLLAYAGVGVLTIGTVLVLWGHFAGQGNYASTGWLVATGGQMLLFLGVVTLVSGGMQQTTHEVTQRVEYIGERMIRIEQSTRDLLQGPHFGRTSDGVDAAATHERSADRDA
jgi:hypothetical protein